jgi:hypothetical protein
MMLLDEDGFGLCDLTPGGAMHAHATLQLAEEAPRYADADDLPTHAAAMASSSS